MQDQSKPLTPQELHMGATPFSQDISNSSVDFIQVSLPLSPVLMSFCVNFFINNLSQLAS